MEQKENNRVNRNITMQRFLEPKVSAHFLFLTLDFSMNDREILKFNRDNHSDVSRVFLVRPVGTSNPRRWYHGWCEVSKFSKFVSPGTLKMLSLALSVLRFLCQKFCKLVKFSLRNTLLCGWF